MLAKDRSIKLLAIGTMNPYGVDLPNIGWTKTVLSTLSGEVDLIDGIAVHQAYFPAFLNPDQETKREVYELLWTAPDKVAESLEETAV